MNFFFFFSTNHSSFWRYIFLWGSSDILATLPNIPDSAVTIATVTLRPLHVHGPGHSCCPPIYRGSLIHSRSHSLMHLISCSPLAFLRVQALMRRLHAAGRRRVCGRGRGVEILCNSPVVNYDSDRTGVQTPVLRKRCWKKSYPAGCLSTTLPEVVFSPH